MPRSSGTHFSKLAGLISTNSRADDPQTAEVRADFTNDVLELYDGSVWRGVALSTTTSTTTST